MTQEPTTEPTNRRVLVIDDEDVVHASLRKILSRLGFGVDGVLSARDGLARLQTESFDLIITDLMMPQMNGIELLQELRARGNTTPILMVTGYPTIRTAVQAMRLGAVDYVAKPFTRKELLSPVKRALRIEDQAPVPEPAGILHPQALAPGMVVYLPHHAWARFEQDGTFLIGVEHSFLGATGTITAITPPQDIELIEQGFVGLVLTNKEGDAHGVAMPLSGQVVAVNEPAFDDLAQIEAGTWLLRVLPSQLADELPLLVLKG
jgi:CheY-like chemotaxis protein